MSSSTNVVPLWVTLALALPAAAAAQTGPGTTVSGRPASSATAGQGTLADGEVLEIYKKDKRVLLKHGPIQHIGMDAMTMEFGVPDGKLLASLKRGDRVRFAAIWKNGDYEVTHIEVTKRVSPK